ncbi:hypothetical protein FB451DRAFT_40286 [Mycena latifolia]|nr:hypothetical protein FB451DRAFT_40286 [Mycena latifolia]
MQSKQLFETAQKFERRRQIEASARMEQALREAREAETRLLVAFIHGYLIHSFLTIFFRLRTEIAAWRKMQERQCIVQVMAILALAAYTMTRQH